MARPRKISSEKLIEIIDKYVEDKVYIRKLKYSDLVKYANEIGFEKISFQDFSRNTTVKEYVENINKLRTTPGVDSVSDCNIYNHFDIEANFETFRGRERQLIPYLKMVQQSYKDTYDRQNELYNELQKLHVENKRLLSVIFDKEQEIIQSKKKYKELYQKYNTSKSKVKEIRFGTMNEYKYKCAKYFIEDVGYKGEIDLDRLLKNFENDKNYDSDIFTEEELAEHISNNVTLEEYNKDDDAIQETKKEVIETNVISFKRPESVSLIPKFLDK